MKIGSTEIGPGSVYFIAEAGSNHNGDIEIAKRLATVAAESGADAVKFQTFVPENLVPQDGEQIESIRQLALDTEEIKSLQKHTKDLGITFLSTPFDRSSLVLLDELGVEAIKISSGDLINYPLLEHAASFGRPMIISTGMANRKEIEDAENRIQSIAPDIDVAFLHCVSAYPTDVDDLNLRMITDIRNQVDGPVGFSDHSIEVETPGLAVATGATIVEKHFTISRRLPVPDAEVSLEPDELARSVEIARNAANSQGMEKKEPVEAEKSNRRKFRKSVHAVNDIQKDTVIGEDDIYLLRPADGLPPSEREAVIGREAESHISAGDPVTLEDLKSEG